jgi:hypothetical protein
VAVADLREARGHRAQREVLGRHASSSSQVTGADTRASGLGRTEYALATVRSLAFWL